MSEKGTSTAFSAEELIEGAEHALAVGYAQAAKVRIRNLGQSAAGTRGSPVRPHLDVGEQADDGQHALLEVARQAAVRVSTSVQCSLG